MARKPEPPGKKPFLVGLVKVTINYSSSGPQIPSLVAANILHTKWSDNVNHPTADLTTLANGVAAAHTSNMIPLMTNQWQRLNVIAQSLGGDGVQAENSTAVVGGTAGAGLVPAATVCTTWFSNATWRGGRPRTYWPAPTAAVLTTPAGGALTTAAISAWGAGSLSFLTAVNAITAGGASAAMGFPSYYTNYTIRTTPLWFPFTGVRVHGRIDSQRRRTGKERLFA